jgi:hypothetical protein
VTAVNAEGDPAGIADNAYVTDSVTSISVTPNIETGNTFAQRNGCGCKVASFKSNDTFNWFEFSFQNSKLEPALMNLLLGSDTIVDGTDVVGQAFLGALECDEEEPAVALEFWTQHIVGSGQDSIHPWIHWVFPKTVWQLGDNTFEEGIALPTVNGFSRTNTAWGDGPYGDGPPGSTTIEEGGWWKTAVDPPAATCDYTDVVGSTA